MSATPPPAQPEPLEPPKPAADTQAIAGEITRIEALENKAKSSRGRNLWVQVSRVGTLGWLIALPIVGGVLLGHMLDLRFGTGMTFALAFMLIGVLLAGYALWRHTRELGN